MDPPVYLEDDFSHLDGLDDDVFHSDDCELVSQSSKMAFRGIFTQSKSYNCLLGRFQLFPLTHCCGPGSRHAKQQDKATQTLNASSSSQDIMLPCGVTEEPQRLFYGNAGYRLHVQPIGFTLNPHLQEEPQESLQELRTEVQIARKLQCIADQFHRLHLQRKSHISIQLQLLFVFLAPALDHWGSAAAIHNLAVSRYVVNSAPICLQQLPVPERTPAALLRLERKRLKRISRRTVRNTPGCHQQNRNQVWWQILLFLHNFALNVEANRQRVGQR